MWIVFQFNYLIGIIIKHYDANNTELMDQSVLKYLYQNSEYLNLYYFHSLFGNIYILLISFFLTILTYLFVKKIFKTIRLSNLKRGTQPIKTKTKTKLHHLFNPKSKNIIFLAYSGIYPHISRAERNIPCIKIPKKMLKRIETDKFRFIIYHELYHIINKDYLKNKTFLKTIYFIFVLSLIISILLRLFLYKFYSEIDEVSIFFYISFLALLIYSFISSNKLNELRADLYAYKKTSDNNYSTYFSKHSTFLKRLFYPSNKERTSYIDNFLKKELSFKTIFTLIFSAECLVFFVLGWFPYINSVNILLLLSLIIVFLHSSMLNRLIKLKTKVIVFSYVSWFASIILLLLIFGFSTVFDGIDYDLHYIFIDFSLYLLPFITAIPFLILTTKLKNLNYRIVLAPIIILIIINDVFFGNASLTYIYNLNQKNYPTFSSIILIFGLSYLINLIYSIIKRKGKKNEVPVGNIV